MAEENEFNFNFDNNEGGSDELFAQLNEEYNRSCPSFKDMCPQDILKQKLDNIANTKEVFQRVLAEHRGDGDYASLVLGAAATKALAKNLLAAFFSEGMPGFVGHLCNAVVMPMVVAWQAEEERNAIEKEIEELEH
jgi:hypothetical protein